MSATLRHGASCYVHDRNGIGERLYMAHPVGGDVEGNIKRARAWYQHLSDCNPHIRIVCPWLLDITIWDDGDPEARELGLQRCLNDVGTCHGIILVGRNIQSGGQRELARALVHGLEIHAMTGPDKEWPPGWEQAA